MSKIKSGSVTQWVISQWVISQWQGHLLSCQWIAKNKFKKKSLFKRNIAYFCLAWFICIICWQSICWCEKDMMTPWLAPLAFVLVEENRIHQNYVNRIAWAIAWWLYYCCFACLFVFIIYFQSKYYIFRIGQLKNRTFDCRGVNHDTNFMVYNW